MPVIPMSFAYADAAATKRTTAPSSSSCAYLQKIRRLSTPQVVQLASQQLALAHYQDALETCAKGLKRAPESAERFFACGADLEQALGHPRKNTGWAKRIED